MRNAGTAGRGEKLTFTLKNYMFEIMGFENLGSTPVLFHTSETGNEDEDPPHLPPVSVCDGLSCFSCADCVVVSE